MNLERIREKIKPIVEQASLEIVNVRWDKMGHLKVLEISLQNEDKTLDLDEASAITLPISEALDEMDGLDFEYILDIGSPGVEKNIPLSELENYLNQYIRIEFNENKEYVEGTLAFVDDDKCMIKYFIKGRPTKLEVLFNQIKKIHLAVKF